MSKPEVCAYVGKSKRTIDNYISTGRLRVGYFNGPNGKTGIFQRADVEALKRELESPTYRAVVPAFADDSAQTSVSASRTAPSDPQAFATVLAESFRAALLPALLPAASAPEPKRWAPWLSLSEAADYSGLPAGYLLAQARAGTGTIRAINAGTGAREFWRFHRVSLAK